MQPKPKRPKQLNLLTQASRRGPKRRRPENVFGGMYSQSYNPSTKRPIDSKKALHLTLKSSQARGHKSFKNKIFEARIFDIVADHAEANGITLYSYANGGNHLHILLRSKHRDDYTRFIRSVTGLIARLVGGSERGKKLAIKFWDNRPFSRVVSFAKREFEIAKRYLTRNVLEAIGWMPYVPRQLKLSPYWKMFLATTITV